MPYLFCLPFPNRASDSGDLYIDFNQNHLTFLVALLDFHVEARFNHSFAIMHMHRILHPAYHPCSCGLFTMLCASFRCCFFGLVPIMSCLWGPIRLRPFVFFMDSFFFLAGFQARWSYPRNHYYLCFARCSLFCYAYATMPTTCLSCLPNCHVKPLTMS